MNCSPEKLAANRANGAKSKGPVTEAGKQVSRGNALKHGMTGAGLALPDEDAAEVQAILDQQHDEMKPKTQAGVAIAFTIALCYLRLNRFALAESAISSQRILDAGYTFDDAQVAKRDEAKAKLLKDPSAQLEVLSRFQVGAQWVIDAWNALACALSSEKLKNWRQAQFDLFEALMGRSKEFPSYDDSTFWSLAAMGDESVLDDREMFAGNSPAARCQDARNKLMAICEAEVERWDLILETATAATAVARANAIKAARYDGSKEGLLAKKYEAATRRDLDKALKSFALVEAQFAEPEPVAESFDCAETCVELGSFLPASDPSPEVAPDAVPQPEIPTTLPTQSSQIPTSDRSSTAPTPAITIETVENQRL